MSFLERRAAGLGEVVKPLLFFFFPQTEVKESEYALDEIPLAVALMVFDARSYPVRSWIITPFGLDSRLQRRSLGLRPTLAELSAFPSTLSDQQPTTQPAAARRGAHAVVAQRGARAFLGARWCGGAARIRATGRSARILPRR